MESDTRNTSELLHKLKIERNTGNTTDGISAGKTLAIALLMAALGAAAGYSLAPAAIAPNAPTALPVTKIQADSRDLASQTPAATGINNSANAVLNASGYITPRRVATVSAEVMGLINSVDVEEGMSVVEGQVLARLDDTIAGVGLKYAQSQITAAKARVAGAEAALQEAQRQARRAQENSYSSELEKSQAVTGLSAAQANLAATKADLDSAEIEAERRRELVADHVIRAPFSGVVTVKNAQPGEIVAPSSAGGGFTRTGICTIVDMDSLEIEVDVNESFIGRVSAEQRVEAKLDAYPDWTIPATVIAIIPTADRGKATVRVRIKIEIKDDRILPDMGVKVAFY